MDLSYILFCPLLNLLLTTSQIYCQDDDIPVELTIAPYIEKYGKSYVTTGEQVRAAASILDSTYMTNETTYEWSTKDGLITAPGSRRNWIRHIFNQSSDNNFIKVVVNDATKKAQGSDQFNFDVRTPVKVFDPIGKLFIEHGELLNVTLTYSGSPPFMYCYTFCPQDDVCYCIFYHQTQNNHVSITHYLHQVGEYTLQFIISNDLNTEDKHYTIKVTEAIRPKTIPYAPIVCTILAVCILMSGVALHLKFRQTTFTETANFDFTNNDEDEWNQELSFIQRARYLLHGREAPNERSRLIT